MATPRRFERLTHSLEGCCSIQLSYGAGKINCAKKQVVGATGFEPTTSCSQSKRSTRLSYAPPTTSRLIKYIRPICKNFLKLFSYQPMSGERITVFFRNNHMVNKLNF